jgi:hypothetical protein
VANGRKATACHRDGDDKTFAFKKDVADEEIIMS